MNCYECNQPVEIKKYKAYHYEGINLNDVHLFNVEVMVCAKCESEMPLLPRVAKLHQGIGLAVLLQPARLSGADAKFLRRNAGFSLQDWSNRIGLAEGTYSKLEHGRQVSQQNDRLIRINYLNALKQKNEEFHLAKFLEKVLTINTKNAKNFAIAVDAEQPETEAKYLPYNSPLLAEPTMSITIVEAKSVPAEIKARVYIIGSRGEVQLVPDSGGNLGRAICGEMANVRNNLIIGA